MHLEVRPLRAGSSPSTTRRQRPIRLTRIHAPCPDRRTAHRAPFSLSSRASVGSAIESLRRSCSRLRPLAIRDITVPAGTSSSRRSPRRVLLDVPLPHRLAIEARQGIERGPHGFVRRGGEECGFRIERPGSRGSSPAIARGVNRMAAPVPATVPEGIPENREQPRTQVAARPIPMRGAERLDVGLLHQIFGVGSIPGQPERRGVQVIQMAHGLVGKGSRRPLERWSRAKRAPSKQHHVGAGRHLEENTSLPILFPAGARVTSPCLTSTQAGSAGCPLAESGIHRQRTRRDVPDALGRWIPGHGSCSSRDEPVSSAGLRGQSHSSKMAKSACRLIAIARALPVEVTVYAAALDPAT